MGKKMEKVIVFSFFAAGAGPRGSSFSTVVNSLVRTDVPLDFTEVRSILKNHWKGFLVNNTPVSNEIRYYASISIITKGKSRFKNFKLDPKNIK